LIVRKLYIDGGMENIWNMEICLCQIMAPKAPIVSIILRFFLTSRDISCLNSDGSISCSSSRISTPTWK